MTVSLLIPFLLVLLFPSPCFSASVLDYDTVVEKVLQNSHDIEVARQGIGIGRASLKSTSSLLYPVLGVQWGARYARSLRNDPWVGDAVMHRSGTEAYGSTLLLTGTYSLLDFGATVKRASIARDDVGAKEAVHGQTVRDVRRKVLDIYTALLVSSRELEMKRQLLGLSRELLEAKERLCQEGILIRDDAVEAEIKVLRTLRDIDILTGNIQALCCDLGFYTGETYGTGDIEVGDLSVPAELPHFDIDRTPESRLYALEIKKKQAEMSILRREMLPRIDITSAYSSHGNRRTLETAVHSVRPRDFSIGAAITMTLFDGFKSSAEMDRTQQETGRLRTERDRRYVELSREYQKLRNLGQAQASAVSRQEGIFGKAKERLAMAECLKTEGLIAQTDVLQKKMELLSEKLELVKVTIAHAAVRNRIAILIEPYQ